MAGGINISAGTARALGTLAGLAVISVSEGASSAQEVFNSIGITLPTFGPYRDKQQNRKATYSITIPAQNQDNGTAAPLGTVPVDDNGVGTLSTSARTQTTTTRLYVFDAVMMANHFLALELTKHPLQSGYNISDHAVTRQPIVTLEIAMSDAMAAFQTGMWSTNASKSISAFQVLRNLKNNKILLTLATRQETYENMVITSIISPETNKTFAGLKASVTFEQVFLSTVSSQVLTARPNATDQTNQASIQAGNVSTTVDQQHLVQPSQLPAGNSNSVINSSGVPAGGAYSSNNIASKLTLP